MSQPLRPLEFMGGPLDGAFPPVPVGQDAVFYIDGGVLYQYVIDEVLEGPRIRQVMRLVTQVPMPREKGDHP